MGAASDPQPPVLNALERDECLALLAQGSFGRLVLTTPGGQPLIRPVNYVFDERSQSVIFRSDAGAKLSAVIYHARASFEIDEFDASTGTGWSVIVTGVTEHVTHPAETDRLSRLGLDDGVPGRREHWVRLRARTVSGRRLQPA